MAVVIGGETGIGRATAEALAAAGAHVVIGGILEAPGGETEAVIRAAGGSARFQRTDVREVNQVEVLIEGAHREHGRLDILVNSAGVFDGFATCLETTDALWEQIININLRGCLFGSRAALKLMVPARRGRIINIASVAALRATADGLPYTTSKFAMVGLTRHAACTYAESGVTVNAICPGVIQTDIRANSERIIGSVAPPMVQGVGVSPDGYKRFVPAGRRGTCAEVAALAVFLASDAAGYITGQALAIDGGWSAT